MSCCSLSWASDIASKRKRITDTKSQRVKRHKKNSEPSIDCLFPDCEEKFVDVEERTEHVRKHAKDTFYCAECKKYFGVNNNFVQHMAQQHYSCAYCPEIEFGLEKINDLANYIRSEHKAKNQSKKNVFVCECNSFIAFTESSLNSHKGGKFCSSTSALFYCSHKGCNQKFKDKKNAYNHTCSVHHVCYWCPDQSFDSVIDLGTHILESGHTIGIRNEPLHCYICKDCNFFTFLPDEAIRHVKLKDHLNKNNITNHKEMLLKTSGNICYNKKPEYSCLYCNKSFNSHIRNLKDHILTVEKKCPFPPSRDKACGTCEFNQGTFTVKELAEHIYANHKLGKNKAPTCKYCEKCNYIDFGMTKKHINVLKNLYIQKR